MVKCSICSESVQSVNALKIHYKCVHSHTNLIRFDCGEGCSRQFDSWQSLRKHMLRAHACLEDDPVPIKRCKPTPSIRGVLETSEDVNAELPPQDTIDNESTITALDFKESLDRNAQIFVAKLYQKPNIPRNFVQAVVEVTDELFCSGFIHVLEKQVLNNLENCNGDQDSVSNIREMFAAIKNPFKNLMTEHKRMKQFAQSKFYIPPVSYTIAENRLKTFHTRNGPVTKFVKATGQFVPLRLVLKNLFQLPGALSETVAHVCSLQKRSDFVSNVIQCSSWQRKISNFGSTDIVIPLNFFFDEFEPNAALGNHSEKLGAGYIHIPVLPPSCKSKLENILLALLFDGDDRKSTECGKVSYNQEAFEPLLKELNFLQSEGIVCVTDMGEKRVFFVLCLVFGDNLGMHGIHGFAESFRCNRPCVFCRAPKEAVQMKSEDIMLLRNHDNYNADVVLNDVTLTGIKEASVFNQVKSFSVTEDSVTDVMHDAAEGVCHYVLISVLRHFVEVGYLSVDTLNSRVSLFDFGPSDKDNKPPCIVENFYLKTKFKFTAAEMICFVSLLGVFIGDLVPETDEHWQLYKLTRQILQIFSAKALPKDISSELSVLVYEHHALYLKLTGEVLKPKFHHYVHSSSIFKAAGPFAHYSAIRGEPKHKQLKNYCNVTTSRKNLPPSVAIKHQLMMCHRFAAKIPLSFSELVCGPCEIFPIEEHINYHRFQKSLPKSLSFGEPAEWANWVNFKGTRYEPNIILIVGIENETSYKFGKIVDIIVNSDLKEPLFLCNLFENIGYCDHFGGYEVVPSNLFISICQKDLVDPSPLYDFPAYNGERFVVLKH